MIAHEEQQQNYQSDGAMLRGEDFKPPAVVNVDVSEDLLATNISRDKKTLFWVPVGMQDRTLCARIDTGARRNLMSPRDYEAMPEPPKVRPPGS